jgi:para-aminobenzoate synthetase/4-amino-4-deoxychorismate lyase
VLDYIEAGDTYQVNYTLKLLFDFFGSPEKFYADLRRNQSVSYGAYLRWSDQRIMSFSPELFFWKKGGDVTVRPMKGTVKRGKNIEEDSAHQKFLRSDVKNQSENVMIVDLLRNDLGHLMHHLPEGDVQVDSLFDVETYETLLQMTSTITGRSTPEALAEVSLQKFLETIFPCGSVTGAPKIRTMEIIDELEKDRRGVYTGAIGCLLPDDEAVFNVPIRTIVLNGNKGEMGIGSGIVHDSNPRQEWQECLLKGHFLTQPQKPFQLLETLLWDPQYGYFLLDRHMERLQRSAQYFLFHCDFEEIETVLKKKAQHFGTTTKRLRLILEKDGSFTFNTQDCTEPTLLSLPAEPCESLDKLPKISFSKRTAESSSSWFFHKTTNRGLYDSEYANALEQGLFEVIFLNEKGFVTEGCITNIFAYSDGVYFTPPIADGLLCGTMRQYLLEESRVQVLEKSLTVSDIESAEAIFLCNSVRGVVQVTLAPESDPANP